MCAGKGRRRPPTAAPRTRLPLKRECIQLIILYSLATRDACSPPVPHTYTLLGGTFLFKTPTLTHTLPPPSLPPSLHPSLHPSFTPSLSLSSLFLLSPSTINIYS